jgi:hypothetical protein
LECPFKIAEINGGLIVTSHIDKVESTELQQIFDLSLLANLIIVTASVCYKKKPKKLSCGIILLLSNLPDRKYGEHQQKHNFQLLKCHPP